MFPGSDTALRSRRSEQAELSRSRSRRGGQHYRDYGSTVAEGVRRDEVDQAGRGQAIWRAQGIVEIVRRSFLATVKACA